MQVGILVIFFVVFALAMVGVLVWAIVDIAKSEFPGNGKLIWLLVVLLAGLIGIIIYFAVGRSQKISTDLEGTAGKNPFAE
jgi:peptidoglycan biosynthesis protein MviN/MurJ (putative lipid II flippase)